MAIETPEYLFAAPPKAGCRWMHGALKEVYGNRNVRHDSLHTIPKQRHRPLLSLVRDPADWARSWFQNINAPLDCPADRFLPHSRGDAEPDDAGFRRFVGNFIAAGLSIGAMFAAYDAEHTFRIEDMPGDLEWFLGVQTIEDRDPRATRNPLTVPADVRKAIYEHEHAFCLQWGYPC